MLQLKQVGNKILQPVKSKTSTADSILNGKLTKQVRCMSNYCKGRVIGYIDNQGKPTEVLAKGSGLLAIRTRLDNYMGVQCLCGNDSRLSDHEKGIITDKRPSIKDLETVYERMTKNPSKYSNEVDDFIIESVKEK